MGAGPHVRCKRCGDIIQSMYRHDFKYCKCETIFVDGGSDYLRTGYPDGNPEDYYDVLCAYKEWEPILEKENDCKVYDPDGARAVYNDGKQNDLMTRQEAIEYFFLSTMKFGPTFWEKHKKRLEMNKNGN